MNLSRRSRLSLCQFLDLFDRDSLVVLFEKHGLRTDDLSNQWGGTSDSAAVREAVLAASGEQIGDVLEEALRTHGALRYQISPRYRFDERWNDLLLCFELDGYRRGQDEYERDTNMFVPTEPEIEGVQAVEDGPTVSPEAAHKEGGPIGQTPFAITRKGIEAIHADPDEGAQTLPDALGKLTVAQIATAIGAITGEAVSAKSFNYKTKALDRLTTLMSERDLGIRDVLRAAGIEALTPDGGAVSGLGIAEPSSPPKPAREPRHTKQQALIDMLQRDGGATMEQMVEATGWLAHTVRGAISGALRKKLGLTVVSEKVDGRGRIYRIKQ